MAIEETIGQVLATEQADAVNGLSAQRLFASATIQAVGQGLIEREGRGLTDKFTASADVMASAEIVVRRIIPHKLSPRELGRNHNGGAYAPNLGWFSGSENVSIKTLGIITDLIKIPMVSQAMIPVDLASAELANFVIAEANVLNGLTFAEKFYATFGVDEDKGNITTYTDGTDNLALKVIECNAKLIGGDPEHGFYTFPDEGKVAVIRSEWYAPLYAKGVLVIGNGLVSDAGQRMLADGGVSPMARETKVENGFVGYINGVPCHLITPYVVNIAEEFLGLPVGDLDSTYVGYISSPVGTCRGVATQENFKVVDDPTGQGIIIQPMIKYGCKTFFQKANSHIKQSTFVNPYTGLKALWSTGVDWQVLGVGSRLFPELSFTVEPDASEQKFTAKAECYADNDTLHGTNLANTTIYYVMTDAPVVTFKAFYSAYGSATVKGSCTSGTSKTESGLVADKYLNICAVSSDGSVSIKSIKIVA